MEAVLRNQLERNIARYSWYKIFTKRVYLPLITIQLVNVGKVTVEQLAIIVIVSTVVQGILQIPAGYFADRWGNRRAVILGAAIALPSPLFYAFMPNFIGGLVASALFFGGYAFQSGAIEAFIHDTLIALKKEHDYAKVMGRAQTYGLAGNVILLIVVPATYPINHSLPFIIGFVSLAAMLAMAVGFVAPDVTPTRIGTKSPALAIKNVVTIENVALFIFAGFLSGVSNKGPEFRELAFQHVGIATALFGTLVAAGSLVGAVVGWYVHLLDKMKPLAFYLLDVTVIVGCLALVGVSSDPIVVAAGFILFAGYTRVRLVVFQAKLLLDLKHTYKSTLISALSLFTLGGDIVAISMLTKFVASEGYLAGYVHFALAVFIVGLLAWSLVVGEGLYRNRRASVGPGGDKHGF